MTDESPEFDYEDERFCPVSELAQHRPVDLPPHTVLRVGKPEDGVIRVEWDGYIAVTAAGEPHLFIETALWPKWWLSALGARHHLDLIHRSVIARQRIRGDVEVVEYDTSDDVCIRLTYRVDPPAPPAESALDWVEHGRLVQQQIEHPVELVSDELDRALGRAAHSIAANEFASLHDLLAMVDASEHAGTNQKGEALEALIAAAIQQVNGFTVVDRRRRTETEEIDLTVLNGSDDPLFRQEQAVVLVECKNWSTNVPRNEVSSLETKIRNRRSRCSIAYLVAWSDLTQDARQELFRHSRGDFVIIPITGSAIRTAITAGPSSVAALFRDSLWEQLHN